MSMKHETLYGIDVVECDIRMIRGGTIVADPNGQAIMVVDTDRDSNVFGFYMKDGFPVTMGKFQVICPVK